MKESEASKVLFLGIVLLLLGLGILAFWRGSMLGYAVQYLTGGAETSVETPDVAVVQPVASAGAVGGVDVLGLVQVGLLFFIVFVLWGILQRIRR